MNLISLLEEETKLSVVLKLIKAIEGKQYEGTKKERLGVYSTPEYLNIFDVLESENLKYGYKGVNKRGEAWELDLFEGRKSNMLKVEGVFDGEQMDLSEFLEEDPDRMDIRWLSKNTRSIKTINDEYWTDTDINIDDELVLADDYSLILVDYTSTSYTYWGQDIELSKIVKVIESKSM